MSQTIDLAAAVSATFNGTDLSEIKLNSASCWTKPSTGFSATFVARAQPTEVSLTIEDSWFAMNTAVSGDIIVAGSGFDFPSFYIYNTSGVLLHDVDSPASVPHNYFGNSVAIEGDIIVVGSPYENVNGYGTKGGFYIYNTSGTLLNSIQTVPFWIPYGRNFGGTVAITGSTIVIGASGYSSSLTGNSTANVGWIFIYNTSGVLQQSIRSPNPQYNGTFGTRMAASGDRIVVGQPKHNYSNAGEFWIFNLAGAQIAHITNPNSPALVNFGYYVAISDDYVIVGAAYYSSQPPCSGGYFVYDTNGVFLFKISQTVEQGYISCGFGKDRIAAWGKYLVVGSIYADPTTPGDYFEDGGAWIYDLSDGGALVHSLVSESGGPVANGQGFGAGVSIGDDIVVITENIDTTSSPLYKHQYINIYK